MIVQKIRDRYKTAKVSRGNPTGSRFGGCTAELQQNLYPALTKPEPTRPRRRMAQREGRRIEAWIREEIAEEMPAHWGLEEFPFYFPMTLEPAIAARLERRLKQERGSEGAMWGSIVPGFVPPKVEWPADGKLRFRGLHEAARGIVLDPDTSTGWFPVFVDGVIRHPEIGMAIAEVKSMSNFAFRRSVMGNLSYFNRCQMAGAHVATGLNVVWFLYRKETSHLAEVTMDARYRGRVKIAIDRGNGLTEVLYTRTNPVGDDTEPALMTASGEAAKFPHDEAWDVADVQSPFDPTLPGEIREHIRRVILVEPGANRRASEGEPWQPYLGWHRQYGPRFECENCDGVGTVRCGYCDGTTISKRSKTGKTCGACTGGQRVCGTCEGARVLDEVELKFPCSYAVTPETPVLMADYSWRAAGKLAVGDALISVDEHPPAERRDRAIRPGTITAMGPIRGETYRLVTERGSVTCSGEHPWLVHPVSRHMRAAWRRAETIRVGEKLLWLAEPVAVDPESIEYQGGYVRGLVDGDGTVQRRATAHPLVRVAMADLEPLERLCAYLQTFGVRAWVEPFTAGPLSRRPMSQVRFGGDRNGGDPLRAVGMLLDWPLTNPEAAGGYLAGLFDAEGSIGRWSLRIHQIAASYVTARALEAAERIGMDLHLERWRSGHGRHVGSVRLYGKSMTSALIRFFCRTRPALTRKTDLSGHPVLASWVRVDRVERGPETDLVNLTVDARTFIAGGFVSHNCQQIRNCYPMVRVEVADRPSFIIARDLYEASGLSFTPPLSLTRR